MAKEEMEEKEPKNPFAGVLGSKDEDEEEPDEDDDDYDVSPEDVEAAGHVRAALKSGSDEDLAKALCMLYELHTSGGG